MAVDFKGEQVLTPKQTAAMAGGGAGVVKVAITNGPFADPALEVLEARIAGLEGQWIVMLSRIEVLEGQMSVLFERIKSLQEPQ
jgi:hypothetical protein